MPDNEGALFGTAGAALLFGVYVDAVFNLYSFTNSSPQTTELFAKQRANTLMKYVKIGDIAGIAIGLIGVGLAPKGQRMWPMIGAGSAVIFAHLLYNHALASGTKGALPAQVTEVSPVYKGQALVSGTAMPNPHNYLDQFGLTQQQEANLDQRGL